MPETCAVCRALSFFQVFSSSLAASVSFSSSTIISRTSAPGGASGLSMYTCPAGLVRRIAVRPAPRRIRNRQPCGHILRARRRAHAVSAGNRPFAVRDGDIRRIKPRFKNSPAKRARPFGDHDPLARHRAAADGIARQNAHLVGALQLAERPPMQRCSPSRPSRCARRRPRRSIRARQASAAPHRRPLRFPARRSAQRCPAIRRAPHPSR